MGNLERMEENLQKKKEKRDRLEAEIRQLEEKIADERDAGIIREIRALNLNAEEYRKLQKSFRNKDNIIQIIGNLYELKTEGEKPKDV